MVSSSAQTQISIFINVNVIMIIVPDSPQCHLCRHRRLADENVHCAGSATYQIFLGYRTLTITLNPNPITDPNPNPKINKKQNDTGMKLNIELYLKVDFLGTGVGL